MAQQSPPVAHGERVVQLFPASEARGELAAMLPSGEMAVRLRGFESVSFIRFHEPSSVLVGDEARREVLLLEWSAESPRLVKTWKLPDGFRNLQDGWLLSNGEVILLSRGDDIIQVSSSGSRRIPVNFQDTPLDILSIAVPSDDILLVLARSGADRGSRLYSVMLLTGEIKEVQVDETKSIDVVSKLTRINISGRRIYFSDASVPQFCFGDWLGDGKIETVCVPVATPSPITSIDSDGKVYSVLSNGTLGHFNLETGDARYLRYDVSPSSLSFDSKNKMLLLAYQRPKMNSWPEYVHVTPPSHQSIDWGLLRTVALISFFFFSLISLCATLYRQSRSNPVTPALEDESCTASGSLLTWSLTASVVFSILLVGYYAQVQLAVTHDVLVWVLAYVGIAILFSIIARYLIVPSSSLQDGVFSRGDGGAHITPPYRWYLIFTIFILLALSYYSFSLGPNPTNLTKKTGAWFICGASIWGLLLSDVISHRTSILAFLRKDAVLLLMLGAVCWLTLFSQLELVPTNTHFDATIPGLWAWRVLQGEVIDLWTTGYTPVPVAGLAPEMLGMYLFGPTPYGFRVGAAAFGASGVLAVYTLGRLFAGRWFGFWCGILLAGNTTYMHFSRITTCGSAITTAFWVICLFVLAWKFRAHSLWLLLGVFGGFSLYHWPVSRVGGAAVAVALILLLIRYPSRLFARVSELCLALLGFIVMISPLIPSWMINLNLLFPRVNTILPPESQYRGLLGMLDSTFGEEFLRCFAWFFREPDHSAQGSVSPGLNPFEAVLFALGLATMFTVGRSMSIVLLPLLLITLTVCGSLTRSAWYTRLSPTVLVAVFCMTLTVHVIYELISKRCGSYRSFIAVVISFVLIFISPVLNFNRYVAHETSTNRRHMEPLVALGRRVYELGPSYEYGILSAGEPTWQIAESFSRMLPYIMERRMVDVFEVATLLPVPPGRKLALLIPKHRAEKNFEVVRRFHPEARVEKITDLSGAEVGQIVLIENLK